VTYLLRCLVVAYLFFLIAWPLWQVVTHTFDDGLTSLRSLFEDPDMVEALRLSVEVAIASVIINTLFGVGMSVLLVRYEFPGKRALSALLDLPLSVSPIVVGLSLVLVYGGRNGWFGPSLEGWGFEVIFSTPGIIMATTFVALPLMIREVVPVLEEIGIEQEQAAESLGANAVQRFWRITLPSIKWGIVYGVVLTLARSLGEFGAVKVVSGNVLGQTRTATLAVEEKYLRVANYAMNMNKEIDMIAHSCGVRHARELAREHVRIVQASGQSVALNMLYPYPEPKAKMKVA